MLSKRSHFLGLIVVGVLSTSLMAMSSLFLGLSNSFADGCAPGEPCWEDPKPVAPPVAPPPPLETEKIAPAPVVAPPAAPAPAPAPVEEAKLLFGLTPGFNVFFFDCQDTEFAPALYLDTRSTEVPLNLRVGIEGTRIRDAQQFRFTPESQFFGDEPDFNFLRFPLSLEGVIPVLPGTDILVGGGPDLLVIRGDGSDTDVGWHVGARLEQAVTERFAVSAGGGYLWGEADARGEDLDLDSAFVGASLTIKLNP